MNTAKQIDIVNTSQNVLRDILQAFGWLASVVVGIALPICLLATFTDHEKYSTLIVLALNLVMLPGVFLFLRAYFKKKHANGIFLAVYGFINPMGWGLLLLKGVDRK